MSNVNILPLDISSASSNKGATSDNSYSSSSEGRQFGEVIDEHLASEASGKKLAAEGQKNESITPEKINKKDNSQKSDAVLAEKANVDVEENVENKIDNKPLHDKDNLDPETTDIKAKENDTELVEPSPEKALDENEDIVHDTKGEQTSPEDFISFISASAQLISEDKAAANKKDNDAVFVSKEKSTDSGVELKLTEESFKSAISHKFMQANSLLAQAISKQNQASGDESQVSVSELVTSNLDEASLKEGKAQRQALYLQLENAKKSLLSDSTGETKTNSLAPDSKLNVQNIAEAKAFTENLLSNAQGELSVDDINDVLIKNPAQLQNPIIRQMLNTLSPKNESDDFSSGQLSKVVKEEASELNKGELSFLNKIKIPEGSANKSQINAASLIDSVKGNTPQSDIIIKTDEAKHANAALTTQDKSINQSTASAVASVLGAVKNDTDKVTIQQLDAAIDALKVPMDDDISVNSVLESNNRAVSTPILRVDNGINASSATSVIDESTRSEQSLDMLLNAVSNDTNIQSPKSITPQQAEVISIYRKDFADAVKEKVMVMMNQKLQQVDIQLDPPELGNVHVRVNLQNEQAMVNFTVQNQQAKEALEQNLGKLRDLLAQNGVDVGDANVNQQSNNNENLAEGGGERSSYGQHDENSDEVMASAKVLNMVKGSATGIDYYA